MDNSEMLLYQTEDGQTKIDVRLEEETIWLSQAQMGKFFQKERSIITKHINNIFKEGELEEEKVCANFAHTTQHGAIKGKTQIKNVKLYNITQTQGVREIYPTSIDYDPSLEMSVLFFKTVQNKMHWAAHGHTAAEIIYKRIDSGKPHLGLSNFIGKSPTKQETVIAKNYLTEEELDILNRIVTAYLELAEIQALNQEPMYMKDWIEQLDTFLKMTRKEILSHTGTISHAQALQKAHAEYEKYKELTKNELSEVEKHFLVQIADTTKKLKNKKGKRMKYSFPSLGTLTKRTKSMLKPYRKLSGLPKSLSARAKPRCFSIGKQPAICS